MNTHTIMNRVELWLKRTHLVQNYCTYVRSLMKTFGSLAFHIWISDALSYILFSTDAFSSGSIGINASENRIVSPRLLHWSIYSNGNGSIVDSKRRPRCRNLINSTKHCSCLTSNWYRHLANFFGPIPWGHSGPLCHALSLSSLSLASWTSMRRRRATVPLATSGELA